MTLKEELEQVNNIFAERQESEDEHEDGYQLKTNFELIDIICDFGNGETEFHTCDIERLVMENEAYKKLLNKILVN